MSASNPGRDPAALLPLTPAAFHVLVALADSDLHGYAVIKEVSTRTAGRVELGTGTLYGIIKRLLADDLISESAAGSDARRRAYRLTPFGRKVAAAETARLGEIVATARLKRLLPALRKA
jgi:DNA-binding PadR family transcriptional regulator